MKSDPVDAVIEAMQSKAKPTKAANRAAKIVMDKLFNDYPYEPGWAARLIDLETGLPELIDAAKEALHCMIPRGADTRTDRAMQQLVKAIAKAEGT